MLLLNEWLGRRLGRCCHPGRGALGHLCGDVSWAGGALVAAGGSSSESGGNGEGAWRTGGVFTCGASAASVVA